jgi:hypothetical protein
MAGAPVGFRIATRHPERVTVPTGHFALETHVAEIATAIRAFLTS